MWSICAGSCDWPKCKTMVMPTSIQGPHSHTQACSGPWQDGIRGSEGPVNLPSFPRDSSSFWIWFSRKNMATANASSARSCNLGGIMTLSSPIKSSRERWWSVHAQRKRRRHRKHTHSSDDGGYKAAESVCMALSLSPSVCVDISQRSDPVVTSNATCSNSAWWFHSVKSRQSGRRGRGALEISPEYVFVPPGFVRDGTSRCRLRPPHRAVPSHPVCSQPHHGHTVTTTQAIGCINSPPHSRDLPFVDSLCLFLSDWTVFRCGTQNWTPGVALPLATMKWPRRGRISLGWLGLCQNTKKHKIKKKYYFYFKYLHNMPSKLFVCILSLKVKNDK